MDEIINKLIKSDKHISKKNSNKNKQGITFNQLELEIQLKIETEKTKQLELIKDIKKIEKSIKYKELYNKRSYFSCKKCINSNNKSYPNSENDSDSDSDTDSDNYDSETDFYITDTDDTEISENLEPQNVKKFIKSSNSSTSDNDDSLSMCSSDTDIFNFNDYEEIDVIL